MGSLQDRGASFLPERRAWRRHGQASPHAPLLDLRTRAVRRTLFAIAVAAGLAACDSAAIGAGDGGRADARTDDGGPPPAAEAGEPDTGSRDAAQDDTGPVPPDAGDAGDAADSATDTGPADAGCRPEVCNGLDDDCDGLADDGIPTQRYYRDADGDLRGDPATFRDACAQPDGYVAVMGDCDDGNVTLAEGLLEICSDGVDNDCDGSDVDICVPAPPVPVAVAPWNGYRSGSLHAGSRSLRPVFRFRAPEGTLEHEIELSCTGERGCTFTTTSYRIFAPAGGVVRWSPAADLPVSTVVPVGTRYRWRVRSCVGTHCSELSASRYLEVGRPYDDVDGDGYSDVVAGDDQADGTFNAEGSIELFFGSPGGIVRPAGFVQPAPDAVEGARFGNAMSFGDVNADGFDDLAVGAYKLDWPELDEGNVYVYLGSADGLVTPPVRIDSPSDQTDALFGVSVHVADLDGDGFADVVAGAPYETVGTTSDAGRAYVFGGDDAGPATTPTQSFESSTPAAAAHFGASASACDLDADGYPDLLVGEDEYRGLLASQGRIHRFPSSAMGIDESHRTTIDSPAAGEGAMGERFGAAACGDVDDDGYRDVLIGAWTAPAPSGVAAGSAFLFPSGPAGLGAPLRFDNPSGEAEGGFGHALGLGDVDGDGHDDLVIGAHQQGTGTMNLRGDAFLYVARSGFDTAPPRSLLPRAVGDAAVFGRAIAATADVDGDGDIDVLVGAPGGGSGSVFVFMGDPTMPLVTSVVLSPSVAAVSFGRALAWLDPGAGALDSPLLGNRSLEGGYLGNPLFAATRAAPGLVVLRRWL